ncbi:PAS domain-containing protein [Polyangium aurulentum]|uniref:PAS domain-containing protein n=1 Tax=Polyangium aurulentum TaxID=2567896 RepID=UPI0010ADC281|nr:PAS domain-containing protein [Polyangium aurulentum]UQA54897.1 PAS domain-containing protein [Polyangium aurulentum]
MTNLSLVDPSHWRSFDLLQRVIDTVPDPIFIKDREHRWIAMNQGFCRHVGRPYEVLLGKSDWEFMPPEQAKVYWEHDDLVFESGVADENQEFATGSDGIEKTIWTRKYPMRDDAGNVIGLCGIVTDITTMKDRFLAAERLEIENRGQLALIEAQREMLARLAVPVVRIWEGVLLLPLVGALTQDRAELVTESVLDAIGRASARFVIIDVTGVPLVDTMAADALLRTVRAASLLGCESVLVGIGAAMAQTLIGFDIDLGRITTRATLERGLEYALGRLSYRIVRAKGSTASGTIT